MSRSFKLSCVRRRGTREFRALCLLASVSILLCGCGRDDQPGGQQGKAKSPPGAQKEIVIGAALVLSGPVSFIGEPERRTLEMLVAEANKGGGWNGSRLRLRVLDSGGDKARAKAHVESLMAGGALVVLGPSTSGESLAVRELAASYKVPLISLAASHKIVAPPSDWVFKTAQSDSLAVDVVYSDLKRRGLKRVSLLFAATGFGQSGAEQLRKLSSRFGITILEEASFSREDTNLSGVVARLVRVKPDALVVWGTSPGPAEATKAARALGFSGAIYQSHGAASEKFLELAGESANGVRLPASKLLVLEEVPANDPQRSTLMAYAKSFKDTYPGAKPSHFGGHAWDAFQMVKRAVLAGATTPSDLRARLEAGGTFPGVTGVFDWKADDHEGLTPKSFALIEIVGRKWKRVDP